MIRRLTAFYAKRLLFSLAAVLIAVSVVPGAADAMVVPAAPPSSSTSHTDRGTDLTRVQAALEIKAVQQRLMDYGLTAEEAAAKVNRLSDEQVHLLAANIDALQAGGRHSDDVIIILLLVLLIVILI